MGTEFTVKDFRTYAANYLFVELLLRETNTRTPDNTKKINKNIKKALERTAKYLRHTKTVSKKSYIMEFCINLYQSDPYFFINNKNNNVDEVLLSIIKSYKKTLGKK